MANLREEYAKAQDNFLKALAAYLKKKKPTQHDNDHMEQLRQKSIEAHRAWQESEAEAINDL